MVIVRIWEGLGNQLFQYAYARALQLRTNEKVYLDADRIFRNVLETDRINRKYSLDYFNIKLPKAVNCQKSFGFIEQRNWLQKLFFCCSQKGWISSRFLREENVEYKEELMRPDKRNNYYLMGWFQNEEYFKEYRDILLKELSPKKKIAISGKLRAILKNEVTVSVHIRRTDYKKTNNALPISYYIDAKKRMEEVVENPYYVIFSDDIEWVKDNLDFGDRAYYVSAQERLEDYEELLVMSACKHNIIANSTFSWWGAWLNKNANKIVIGPRVWFNAREDRSKLSIMPKEWIRV